jgi:hypothetical protein
MVTPDPNETTKIFDKIKSEKLAASSSNGPSAEERIRMARQAEQLPPPSKRKQYLKIAGGTIALVIVLFIWALFLPRNGTIHYGICQVFAERYITFPSTMRVRDVEYFGLTVRVFATHIDAAGQYRYDQFLCEFNTESLEIQEAQINRKVVNPAIVAEFNKGLDAILLNPPDLTLPPPLSDLSIKELWHGKY